MRLRGNSGVEFLGATDSARILVMKENNFCGTQWEREGDGEKDRGGGEGGLRVAKYLIKLRHGERLYWKLG